MTTRSVLLRPGLYGLVFAMGAAAFACSDDDDPAPMNNNTNNNTGGPTQNIVELATANGLDALVQAATTAGLASALQNTNPLTVFAPTDAAFAELGDAAPTDPELLANVLLHHVVNQELDSGAVTTMGPFTTLAKTSLAVDTGAMPITVGGAALSSTLDVRATNGIVHVMDEVIIPPTIIEATVATEDLSSLEAAVLQSSQGVQDTLGTGPLTVFAPTNAAFAASGIDLSTIDQATLDDVLRYHVVTGQNTSDELTDGQTIVTASGDSLTVNVSGGAVTLTDAAGNTVNVVTSDIRLLNGVVHIIDGVLDPVDPNAGPGNIVQVASDAGFSTLLAAATRVGLAPVLSDATATLTVFAPTDAAFSALGVDLMPVSDDIIANILLQHVVADDVPGTEVAMSPTLTTAAKLPLVVDASNTPIFVGGSTLSATIDVPASNGRIHVMDEVIVPPTILETAASLADFSSLVAAVGQSSAEIQTALAPSTLTGADPITVFAPTNAAFTDAGIDLDTISQSQLDRVLSHHAVVGQALSSDLSDGQVISTLNGDITVGIDNGNVSLTDESGNTVNVVNTDIRTLTGVIHVIDGVLIPQPTIVDIAVEAEFTSLVNAVVATDLVGTLNSAGPFTVFAPSNAAFTALGVDLTPVSADVIANILLHHVVPGTFDSTAVLAESALTTAAKTSLAVDGTSTPITIGAAALSGTLNLNARNGIVHVMDGVIVPPTIVEVAQATPTLSTLVSAL
ncbi:MAG: fasciclin domain-containing protein, partial [Myxococcota bacterium]